MMTCAKYIPLEFHKTQASEEEGRCKNINLQSSRTSAIESSLSFQHFSADNRCCFLAVESVLSWTKCEIEACYDIEAMKFEI